MRQRERFASSGGDVRHRRSGRRHHAPPRSSGRRSRGIRSLVAALSLSPRRAAPFLYGVMVAILSLLPNSSVRQVRGLADQTIDFFAVFAYLAAVVLAACIVVSASKARMLLRFSWPLFAAAVGYAIIMGMLILQVAGYSVTRHGAAWLDDLSVWLNVHHAVVYALFAVIAAVGWRDRMPLPLIGAILIGWGALLELLQESVPGRESGMPDVFSNAIGVLVGLLGVRVMGTLRGRGGLRELGAGRLPRSASGRRWRQT